MPRSLLFTDLELSEIDECNKELLVLDEEKNKRKQRQANEAKTISRKIYTVRGMSLDEPR